MGCEGAVPDEAELPEHKGEGGPDRGEGAPKRPLPSTLPPPPKTFS